MGNNQFKKLTIEEIVDCVLEGIDSSPYTGIDYDTEHIKNVVESFASYDDPYTVIFAFPTETGECAGVLLGSITTQHPLFHKGRVAHEVLWYVRPQYRGTKNSIQMLINYETWAKEMGATHITVSSLANEYMSAMNKLCSRRGYSLVETHYMKEID